MLRPYPNTLPIEAASNLVAYLRGNGGDKALAVHSAYEVAGYGLGIGLPDGPPLMASAPLSDDALADALEAHVGNRGTDRTAIPWGTLAPLILNLLLKWLLP